MGQLVSKRYVLHMVDRYAGTAFEASCDARGDTDMKQVPSMTWLLTMIDRVNGYATNYRTSEYATRQAVTKPTVDGATKSLIRSPFFITSGNSRMAFSINGGANWAVVANNPFGGDSLSDISPQSIAYGGGRFVAGTVTSAYSTDGANWTKSNNVVGGFIVSIAYGDDKFFAVTGQGTIAYSADGGANWTIVENSPFGILTQIAYGGGKWVVASSSGKIAYSTDGMNWTAVANSPFSNSEDIGALVYGSGKFVAGGRYGSSGNSKIAYSADGVSWTKVANSTFGTSSISALAYSGSKFVAGGRNGKMAYSSDGITWTAVANSSFGFSNINDIAYGGGKWVAVGGNGKIAYSTDGVSWTSAGSPIGSEALYAAATRAAR